LVASFFNKQELGHLESKSTPYFMSPCSLMSEFKDIHKMD
jgi:hypothetical protein